MPGSNLKSAFLKGLFDGAPFFLVLAPFGLLFGVVGTEAGLHISEVMGFSALLMAGAAQFTALELLGQEAPTIVILATALAVNLRLAMYSAALTPHLGQAPLWQRALAAYFLVDQNYTISSAHFETRPGLSVSERYAYFAGATMFSPPVWLVFSFVGAYAGKLIPPGFALDFALPITFLAMVAPMLRTLAHLAAAVTSVVLALALSWMPPGVGLLVAASVALIVGAAVEQAMERRSR